MDIKSLLSPQESQERENLTPTPTPTLLPTASPSTVSNTPSRPQFQGRKSSSLSQELDLTDLGSTPPPPRSVDQRMKLPSMAAFNAVAAHQQTQARSHLLHQQQQTPPTSRGTPTSGMDTLAELASLQWPQQIASPVRAGALQDPRPLSARSSVDMIMPDAPPRLRLYVAASLSDADCQALTEQATRIGKNSYDFAAHVEFVKLFHKGLTAHVESGADPHGYELLAELRQARQAMDKIFPPGEELWLDWLNDEKLLACSTEDRIALMELCRRAVQDEQNSTSLWKLYGDYVFQLWATAHEIEVEEATSGNWTAEDKEIGKELFKWETMIEVWEQAVAMTQWRLNDSNVVWDRYMEILCLDQAKSPSPQKVSSILEKFVERLCTKAHATWEQTFQNFSSFVSKYDSSNYEETMVTTTQRSAQVKKLYAMRENFELKIQQAINNDDAEAEYSTYMEYLDWELRKKGVFSFHVINSLFERAVIRFPTEASLWIEYFEFLLESHSKDISFLEVLDRASRHCPWSGDLWAHRIMQQEAEGKPFVEIEETKHKATVSGLFDADLESLMKVYIAWAGCLRRRAFAPGASDDEVDVAEVGISSAIEHVQRIGEKTHGADFKGDPKYRLERIQIKFYTQRGDLDFSRDRFKALIPRLGDTYEFWYRFYVWEMVAWAMTSNVPPVYLFTPATLPTETLRSGLHRIDTIDYPEQLIDTYIQHCEQHETVQGFQTAALHARKAQKMVEKRRQKEAAAWEQLQQQQQQQQQPSVQEDQGSVDDSHGRSKRKRDTEQIDDEQISKKTKGEEASMVEEDPEESLLKRDREHTVITVKNLPLESTETRVRQFFRDCGTVVSINLVIEEDSKMATVEFESKEEALFAQTKVTKPFDGNILEIEFSTGSTLWVTNYPPTADEAYIRDIFKGFGEVVEVRFPSLQGNTNRRFCYVQFLNASQALRATEVDGKVLEDKFHLKVKISDPTKKENRRGPMYEGREIFVKDVDWAATEDEVKELFSRCGTVEKVHIPRNMNGKSKGVAFVVFDDKDSAEKATQTLDKYQLKSRIISVEVAKPKAKRTATTIFQRTSTVSPSPEAVSPTSTPYRLNGNSTTTGTESDGRTAKARTLALMDVPDTVTAARIEQLLQPHGSLKKLSLRPDHGGAMAEFVDEKSVGLVSLALEGAVLDGKKIRTGTVDELMRQRPEVKSSRLGTTGGGGGGARKNPAFSSSASNSSALGLGNGVISRPGGPGRRGGLGSKRGGLGLGAAKATKDTNGGGEKRDSSTSEAKKSNADFRAMLLGGKEAKQSDKMDE